MKKIRLYSFYITACIPTLRYLELNTIIHYKQKQIKILCDHEWAEFVFPLVWGHVANCLFYTVILKLIFLKCNCCNECWWKKSVTVHHWHWHRTDKIEPHFWSISSDIPWLHSDITILALWVQRGRMRFMIQRFCKGCEMQPFIFCVTFSHKCGTFCSGFWYSYDRGIVPGVSEITWSGTAFKLANSEHAVYK